VPVELETGGTLNYKEGTVPAIACFNKATTPLGVEFPALIAALQVYVDQYVALVWGRSAKLVKSTSCVKGAWALAFLDDPDQPGALAYHDLTPDGLPVTKVFVKNVLENGGLVSVSASHQLVEMLVDPAINKSVSGPNAEIMYALEAADPVEEESFPVAGIQMSDFVYPSYFQTFHGPKAVQFDQMNLVTKPFQILKGGYQIILKNGKYSQVFGSAAKANRFAREDRRGHRSEQRKAGKLFKADPKEVARRAYNL
jgi:hypothetical protein